MNRNFIFYINPISGTKRKDKLIAFIKNKCIQHHFAFEICYTNASGDYVYLKEQINKNKITDVIICGGDGTVNKITAALININVSVGIIPMGSGNGLAYAAGISSNWNKAFDVIVKNQPDWIDGFYLNGTFGCMLCGLGFDAIVAHDFLHKRKRGLWTYVILSIKNFLRAKSFSFEVSFQDKQINTDAYFISIANSNQFGNYVTIAPQAKLNDGLLDIIIVTKKSKAIVLYALLKQIIAGTAEKRNDDIHITKGVCYFQTNNLFIKNTQLAPIHIDGEPVNTSEKVDIILQKNAFKLLQP